MINVCPYTVCAYCSTYAYTRIIIRMTYCMTEGSCMRVCAYKHACCVVYSPKRALLIHDPSPVLPFRIFLSSEIRTFVMDGAGKWGGS